MIDRVKRAGCSEDQKSTHDENLTGFKNYVTTDTALKQNIIWTRFVTERETIGLINNKEEYVCAPNRNK